MVRMKNRTLANASPDADYQAMRSRPESRRHREAPDWADEQMDSMYITTPRRAQRSNGPEASSVSRSRSRASHLSSTPRRATTSGSPMMDDDTPSVSSDSTMPPTNTQNRRHAKSTSRHRYTRDSRSRVNSQSSDRTEEPEPSRKLSNRSRNASPKSVKSAKSTRSRLSTRPSQTAPPPLPSPAYSESDSDDLHKVAQPLNESDAIQIEMLEADDDSSKDRSRITSRDELMDSRESSVEDRRRFRRRRTRQTTPAYSEDESSPMRRHSISDLDHPTLPTRSASRSVHARSPSRSVHRAASRSLGRSGLQSATHSRAPSVYSSGVQHESSARIQSSRAPETVTQSRPPVTATPQRSIPTRISARQSLGNLPEALYPETPLPRRSNTTIGSGRSRSSSRRQGSIFGSIFSAPALHRHSSEKPVKKVDCIICLGEYPTTRAPKLHCGHRMCHSCLKRSFRLSIKDPSHMPPKCCDAEHIPLKHVEKLFDNSFKKEWNRKFHEFSTRNRIYCPSRKCGQWIKPSNIRRENGRKVARCGRCRTKVCGICNNKWHTSLDCPRDEETSRFLAQAEDEGWKRCYKCQAMVELKEGCNHMTCRCGAEFCMICGTKWKGCDCPWFNYDSVDAVDQLEHMNVPVPHVRGSLGDIFSNDGPPIPGELRGHLGHSHRSNRHGRRPQTYEEEMLRRRMQEEQDLDYARRIQLYDEFDQREPRRGARAAVIDDVFGVGNATGHFMNESYRRERYNRALAPPAAPPPPPPLDRTTDYMTDGVRSRGKRGDSMERRLADRLSGDAQPGMHSVISPMRMGGLPMAPIPPLRMSVTVPTLTSRADRGPFGSAPTAPAWGMPPMRTGGLLVRPSATTEGFYAMNHTPERVGRGLSYRPSFHYEEEKEVEISEGSSGDVPEEPRSSSLAGLTGQGRGMSRVSEWRNWVEPGVPEDVASVQSH